MANPNVVPRRLSLHLLEEMTDGFSPDREIGSGAYGKVYLVCMINQLRLNI